MLIALIIIHCIASALHFAHNGLFLADYPSLPSWLTAQGVYLSWLVITSVGLTGLVMMRRGLKSSGLAVICIYAALGFGGLDHYVVAPVDAHTLAMNATILFEVATAAALLWCAGSLLLRQLRFRRAS